MRNTTPKTGWRWLLAVALGLLLFVNAPALGQDPPQTTGEETPTDEQPDDKPDEEPDEKPDEKPGEEPGEGPADGEGPKDGATDEGEPPDGEAPPGDSAPTAGEEETKELSFADRMAIVQRGDLDALATVLEVKRSELDEVAGVEKALEALSERRLQLSGRAGALKDLRDTTREALADAERRDQEELARGLAAARAGAQLNSAAAVAKRVFESRRRRRRRPPPKDDEAPAPVAEPSREPGPLVVGLRDQLSRLDAQFEAIESELRFVMSASHLLETRLEAVRLQEQDEKRREAIEAQKEVERQQKDALDTSDRAQQELERLKAEAEETDRKLKKLNAEDIRIRSEEINLLGRIVYELPDAITRAKQTNSDFQAWRQTLKTEHDALRQQIRNRNKPEEARAKAEASFRDMEKRLAVARRHALSLEELQRYLRARSAELTKEHDLAEVEARTFREAAEGDSGDRFKQKKSSVAEARLKRLSAYRTVLDLRRRLYALELDAVEEEILFIRDTQHEMLDILPTEVVHQIRRLSDRNLQRARLELTDLGLQASRVQRVRREQAGSWQDAVFSLSGVWWLAKALLLAAMLFIFVSRVRQQRWEIVRSLDKRLSGWGPLRRRRHLALRVADVTGALLTPVTALICVRAMLWLFPPGLPSVMLISTLVQGFLLYMLLIRLLRTLILPRWYREKVFGGEGDGGELREGDNPAELEQALFLMATLRLMLLYTIMCQTTLFLVRQAMGMLFIGYWIHVLGYLGYGVVLYLLLTRWRNTIVTLYEKYAGERSPRSVEFMQKHRDRPWGLLVIFGAFLYVVVIEGSRWAVRRMEHVGLVKRLRNFLFRRRVAIEQRLEREQNEGREQAERFGGGDPWFSPEPPTDPSCVVERPLPDKMAAALESWGQEGRQGWWVIVGAWGMGKSMMLDQVEARSPGRTQRWTVAGRIVTRVDLMAALAQQFELETIPETEAEMLDALLAVEPRIMLVDDTHRIFLREIGGFEACWVFERLMINSSHHHLWITTMDWHAWVYLRQARRKPLAGPGVVQLKPWTSEQLRALIEARMAPSGVEVSFRGLTAVDEAESDEAASVRSAVGYYHLLEEVSSGNPAVAMDCWLRSLFIHNERVEVRLFDNTGHINNLRGLPEEGRFTLTALVQHGELSVTELARVLNIGESLAAELLWELGSLGLLRRVDDGRYTLKRGAFGEVIDHVGSRNLLHR